MNNKNIDINNIENNFIDNSQVYIHELLENLEFKNPNSKISICESINKLMIQKKIFNFKIKIQFFQFYIK
jgi:hypothetical protein